MGKQRLVAAFLFGCLLTAPVISAPSGSIYSVKLGDDRIIALSDGVTVRPLKEVLPGAPDAATVMTNIPINAFLIVAGGKHILVDTGAGTLLGPNTGGQLQASLRVAGIQPEQIDAVLLTHAHPDHIGGLCADGKRLFPNADLYLDRREILVAPAADAPPKLKALYHFQDVMIRPYEAAGHLRTFDGATGLFPGIRSVPAYGHSAGHTAYSITSRGKRLLLWGDIVHVADVQFADPHLVVGSDFDGKSAVSARSNLFSQAAAQNLLVGGAHLPFPGLGHVHADAGKFTWVALPPH